MSTATLSDFQTDLNPSHALFKDLAALAQNLAETRRISEKVTLCATYLQSFDDNDHDLDLAVRYLGEGAFSTLSGRRAAVGHRTIAVCAAQFLEIDYEKVFRPSRIATGSASETIEKLMENLDVAREKRRNNMTLSLKEIDQRYHELAGLRKREEKELFLMQIWKDLTPLEVKYFLRIMGGGSLRIGFESRSLLNAIAVAFACDPEAVRYTHMITGSLGKTAVMARHQKLDEAQFSLFQPIAFMLASAYESKPEENLLGYVAEEKFDGMRCQIHIEGNQVKLYSRDLNEISASFLEISEEIGRKSMPATVLDGEICVYFDSTIQPFQLLQKRMGVKKPSAKLLKQFPVTFIAYDVVYSRGRLLFQVPLHRRRMVLEQVCRDFDLHVVRQFDVRTNEDIERLFTQAVSHGNEGLMLKHRDSVYEFGQRKKSWMKVKKPGGSLDTVILYATAGSGKRGGTYSDFTLGIRVEEDLRFDQTYVPIGKAYGGYTDEELKKLNAAIKPLVRERFGPTLSLEPKIVVEIEFDEIQINRRTKAGFTLRFPRFRAIRWDKSPADTDTLAEVERLYNEKQNRERQTQTSFLRFGD
jgi:DNA ligase 1